MIIKHSTLKQDTELVKLYDNGKEVCRATITHNPKGRLCMGGGWTDSQKIPHVLKYIRTLPKYRNKGYACYLLNYIREVYEKKGEPISWYADPDENLMGFYYKRGATLLYTKCEEDLCFAFIKEEDIHLYWPDNSKRTLEFIEKTRQRKVCKNKHRASGETEIFKCNYIFYDDDNVDECPVCENVSQDDVEIIKC